MRRECVCSRTMKLRETTTGSDCERLVKLEEQLADALARIAELEQENAQLRDQLAKAGKNSSTSSKPPSSDIVKPPKKPPKGGKKRKRGGQPGHERHLRPGFPPEAVDEFFTYTLGCCPDCGHKLCPAARRRRESSGKSKSKKRRHTSRNTRDWPIGALIVGSFTTRRSRRHWSSRAGPGRDCPPWWPS